MIVVTAITLVVLVVMGVLVLVEVIGTVLMEVVETILVEVEVVRVGVMAEVKFAISAVADGFSC